jgi:hypothetical protein
MMLFEHHYSVGYKLNTIKIDKKNGKTLQKSSLVGRQLPNKYGNRTISALFSCHIVFSLPFLQIFPS